MKLLDQSLRRKIAWYKNEVGLVMEIDYLWVTAIWNKISPHPGCLIKAIQLGPQFFWRVAACFLGMCTVAVKVLFYFSCTVWTLVVIQKSQSMESCLRNFLQLQNLTGSISLWCQHWGTAIYHYLFLVKLLQGEFIECIKLLFYF